MVSFYPGLPFFARQEEIVRVNWTRKNLPGDFAVTETEWLECTDPMPMFDYLYRRSTPLIVRLYDWLRQNWHRPNRKDLLVYCAYCRAYWEFISWDKRQKSVETVEEVVDKKPLSEFSEAAQWTVETAYTCVLGCLDESAYRQTLYWGKEEGQEARAALEEGKIVLCDLLRDVFGNPFQPITLDPAWLTPTVTALAQTVYDDRAFERLPQLADELVKSGCSNQEILSHCRGPGRHVRGCWAVDAVLGKE